MNDRLGFNTNAPHIGEEDHHLLNQRERLSQDVKQLISQQMSARSPLTLTIGGVTLGGAGKSQVVLHIAESILKIGIERLYILGHGYRAKDLDKTVRVVDDFNQKGAELYGDEAVMMKSRFGNSVTVLVGGEWSERYQVAYEMGAQVILCDGGLYTAKLRRHLNVTVSPRPCRHRLIPFGDLTRPIRFWARGPQTWLWFVHSSPTLCVNMEDVRLQRKYESELLFTLSNISHFEDYQGVKIDPLQLKGESCGIICAIARPQRLISLITSLGIRVHQSITLRDHDLMSRQHIKRVKAEPRLRWITTEKDKMKFSPPPANLIIAILHLECYSTTLNPSKIT